MTTKAQQLKDQLATLPREDRLELASFLLESTDTPLDPEWEQAWVKELDRRSEELRSGKVKGIPGDQVMRELREKYG